VFMISVVALYFMGFVCFCVCPGFVMRIACLIAVFSGFSSCCISS
jgi:hypothetical protein